MILNGKNVDIFENNEIIECCTIVGKLSLIIGGLYKTHTKILIMLFRKNFNILTERSFQQTLTEIFGLRDRKYITDIKCNVILS